MSSQEIKKLLDKDYVYPDLDDKNLQSKIYKKENFIIIKYQKLNNIKIIMILKNIVMMHVQVN